MTRGATAEWRAAVHAALLAGAATLAVPAGTAPAKTAAFAPPHERPLLLSRKLVRELSGGTAIVATRHYRVWFLPVVDGWQVEGALVASEINAPPALAAIAAIERERPDDGLFPIHLDRNGRILPALAAPGLGREAVADALAAARFHPGGAETTANPGFVARLGVAASSPSAGLTRWPEALFVPHGMQGTSGQAFRLPDGSEGSVQISLESDPAPGLATMGRAARTIVTLAAGTRRVTREEWTLTPAPKGDRP